MKGRSMCAAARANTKHVMPAFAPALQAHLDADERIGIVKQIELPAHDCRSFLEAALVKRDGWNAIEIARQSVKPSARRCTTIQRLLLSDGGHGWPSRLLLVVTRRISIMTAPFAARPNK
jgi:hypothetical protein